MDEQNPISSKDIKEFREFLAEKRSIFKIAKWWVELFISKTEWLIKENDHLRAENEALKARDQNLQSLNRGLVEALSEFTSGFEAADEEAGILELEREYVNAFRALSAIPEDTRELYRLEQNVIEDAKILETQVYEGSARDEFIALSLSIEALQAHKEKMNNA